MNAPMNAVPKELAKGLRADLANAIADFKAYDVPGVCTRLGLADGEEQEAYKSKFKYAFTRVNSEPLEKVMAAAWTLLSEIDNYGLSETISRIEEQGQPGVSEITRRRIIALFDNGPLCTEQEEIDFIKRIWPIGSMPSVFTSFSEYGNGSLKDDIYQHTVRNFDWETRELLEHLGVLKCSQSQFFKFLAAVTDPLSQKDEKQASLVEAVNALLVHDGFKLAKWRVQSGCAFYRVEEIRRGSPADASISSALKAFDPNDIHVRWEQALTRREADPAGAITTARTLLEDVCKWILDQAGQNWNEADDLPALYRKLAKILKLAPDEHTEQVFKQILGSCQSVVESLGALRNKLSDAHSIGPKRARPVPRHAELAVNLSGAMATFLVATWQARQAEEGR